MCNFPSRPGRYLRPPCVSCSLIDFLIGFLLSQPSTPRACTPSASQTHLDTLKRHASRKASAARAQTLHLRRSLVFLSSYLGFFSLIADAVLGSLMVLRSCSGICICISLPFVGEGKLSRTLRKITLVHSSAVRWTELLVVVAIRFPDSCQSREPLTVECVRNGEGLEVLRSFDGNQAAGCANACLTAAMVELEWHAGRRYRDCRKCTGFP